MVWILIAYWAISVKNEDLTPPFSWCVKTTNLVEIVYILINFISADLLKGHIGPELTKEKILDKKKQNTDRLATFRGI